MNTLEELILEDNEIGDEGAGAIANSLLKDLTRLKTWDFLAFFLLIFLVLINYFLGLDKCRERLPLKRGRNKAELIKLSSVPNPAHTHHL